MTMILPWLWSARSLHHLDIKATHYEPPDTTSRSRAWFWVSQSKVPSCQSWILELNFTQPTLQKATFAVIDDQC